MSRGKATYPQKGKITYPVVIEDGLLKPVIESLPYSNKKFKK